MSGKNRVAYFYNEEMGKFYYSKDHPMKPKRISMTHSLIESFDLYRELDVYRSRLATREQLLRFHHPEYVSYLENHVSKDILRSNGFGYTNDMLLLQDRQRKQIVANAKKKNQFHMGESGDCPGFCGLYEFCQYSCGGSIDAAHVILSGDADISINWGGGLHHAKKCEASGFCYTNDIVLSILQLLKFHPRVLYLDIDVHHGDGVEQAFFLTNRVMTVSFHQYGDDFFPGTGGTDSIGEGPGKYYSLNIPLRIGIDDDTFYRLFVQVMDAVMEKYRPGAVVMQLGADSLANDKLGHLNLSIKGHGACLLKMMSYGVPLIMLGGGGYRVENVSRCWAYETGLAIGKSIQGSIPKSDQYYESYLPDNKLHFNVKIVDNKNTPEYINDIRMKVHEHVQQIECAPSVPFHNVPTGIFQEENAFRQMMLQFSEDDPDQQDNYLDVKKLESLIKQRQKLYM